MSGACSALATGWPGIAVPPGSAHSPQGEKQSNIEEITNLTKLTIRCVKFCSQHFNHPGSNLPPEPPHYLFFKMSMCEHFSCSGKVDDDQ